MMFTKILVRKIELSIAPFCMLSIPTLLGLSLSAFTVVAHSHMMGRMPNMTHGNYFLSKFSSVCSIITNPTASNQHYITSLGMIVIIIGSMFRKHKMKIVQPFYSEYPIDAPIRF